MAQESCETKATKASGPKCGHSDMFCGVYGMAFLGAAVYYLGHATTFGAGVLGFLKAIVWPALLIHKVFTLLNM